MRRFISNIIIIKKQLLLLLLFEHFYYQNCKFLNISKYAFAVIIVIISIIIIIKIIIIIIIIITFRIINDSISLPRDSLTVLGVTYAGRYISFCKEKSRGSRSELDTDWFLA